MKEKASWTQRFTVGVLCVATIGPAVACQRQTAPKEQSAEPTDIDPAGVGFGYTDKSGSKLLMLLDDGQAMEIEKAKALETALCNDGRQFPIRYLRYQKRAPDSTGRQTVYNFDEDEGHLYEITGIRTYAYEDTFGETCMLVPPNYLQRFPNVRNDLSHAELETRKNEYATPDDRQPTDLTPFRLVDGFAKEALARIEKEKGRKAKLYWLLHRSGLEQQIAIVEFDPVGESRLASLVLSESNRLSFFDMPATNNGGDCWRVSDGCQLLVRHMDVPIVLGRAGEQLIVFTSSAEEGQVINLLQAKNGNLVPLNGGYRYHMAQ
jgi:hypothetical protein